MVWLACGLGLLLFNVARAVSRLAERLQDADARIGFAFGQSVALSLVACGLAALSKDNRNPRTLGKILFWTQVVTTLLSLRG